MPYLTKKQLEQIRPTVTGIGWADTKQAAVYLGLSYKFFCKQVLPELPYRLLGKNIKRVRYADLDAWMLQQDCPVEVDVGAIVSKAREKFGI